MKKFLALSLVLVMSFYSVPNLQAASIDVAQGATVARAAATDTANFTGAATGTFTVGAGQGFAGATVVNDGNVGTITFAGASTVTAGIGTSSAKKVAVVSVEGAGTTVSLTGANYVNEVNFVADGTLSLASGASLTGGIEAAGAVDNTGTLALVGGTQSVSGAIGTDATHRLVAITAAQASGSTATLSGAVSAIAITMSGTGKLQFDSTVASGAASSLAISSTGEVELNGASTIATTTFTGAGTLDLNGTLTGAVAFGAGSTNATVTLLGGKNISSTVNNTSGADGKGTLTVEAGGNSAVGAVGASNSLLAVNVQSTTGQTTAFSGVVKATTVTIGGLGTATFADDITGALVFSANGTATIADNGAAAISGTTTTGTNGSGNLTVGTATIVGAVGTSSAALNTVAITDAKTGTFTGNVFANTVSIGTGTMTANGNVTATNVNFTAGDTTGTLTLAGGKTLTGAVAAGTTNTGTLTLASAAGTAAVVGQVGSSSKVLKVVNANAGAGEFNTFTGDIYATNFTTGGAGATTVNGNITGIVATNASAGTLNLNGNVTGAITVGNGSTVKLASGKSTSTTINGDGPGQGTFTFLGSSTVGGIIGGGAAPLALNIGDGVTAGGVVRSGYAISAATTTINTGGTLAMTATKTITGDLDNKTSGTLDIGTSTVTLTGAYTQRANSTLAVEFATGTTAGKLVPGTTAVTAGSTVSVRVPTGVYVPNGTSVTIIDNTAAAATTLPTNAVISNSPMYTYTLSRAAGAAANSDIVLTANRATYGSVASGATAGGKDASSQIETSRAAGTSSADMNTVAAAIDQLPTAAAVAEALDQLPPDVSGVGPAVATGALNQHLGLIGGRMADQRGAAPAAGGDAMSGVGSGDLLKDASVWLQGLGNHLDQDKRKGIDGYHGNTFGYTIGMDKVIKQFLVGAAFGMSWSDINSKGAGNTSTDVASYQWTLYGGYKGAEKPYYVDGSMSFGLNDYEGDRHIQFVGIDRHAKSDYQSEQYSWKGETGYTIKPEQWKGLEKLELTPFTSLQYTYLHMNSYKEKGADALNLNVDGEGYHALEQGLGLKIGHPVDYKDYSLKPSIHAGWYYDYIGDKIQTTAGFQGGGAKFTTNGVRPAQHRLNMGGELTVLTKGPWSAVANYDLDLKDEFMSHTYTGTVRYAF